MEDTILKKILIPFLCCLLLLSLFGCSDEYLVSDDPAKTFTEEGGFSIVLTEAFTKIEKEGYTLCYDSSQAAVFCIEAKFEDYPEIAKMSFDDYVADVLSKNADKDLTEKVIVNDITCVEYEVDDLESDQTWYFLTAIMESENAFWLVQFMCETKYADALSPAFASWLTSVSFGGTAAS